MANQRQQLLSAIASQAPDQQTQAALLVGSYGESGWDPNAVGSGGYGAFGFTSPQYTDPSSPSYVPPNATASQQVAAILPAYVKAEGRVPSSVTNPAARAEYQALSAEEPAGTSTELGTIAATNQPTQYGANTSYSVQNWGAISQIVSGTPSQAAVASASSGPTINLNNPLPTWGPSFFPWNWPSDAGNAVIDTLIPWALIIVGVILIAWGLLKTFGGEEKLEAVIQPGHKETAGEAGEAGGAAEAAEAAAA